jgi:hypothetical protein
MGIDMGTLISQMKLQSVLRFPCPGCQPAWEWKIETFSTFSKRVKNAG